MRIFLVVSPTATTSPDFPLKGVAGRTGRLDVIARSIVSAFKVKERYRKNVVFYALLLGPPNPPKLLIINGERLIKPPSSEREALLLIKKALNQEELNGIRVEEWGFRHTINYLLKITRNVYYLREDGEFFVDKVRLSKQKPSAFILGSHVDLPREYEAFLEEKRIPRVSLGKISYLTSQCITIIHWLLDELESSLYT